MKVVVEQSGYDSLNLGDRAMAQAGLDKLHRSLPEARLLLVTSDRQLARSLFRDVSMIDAFFGLRGERGDADQHDSLRKLVLSDRSIGVQTIIVSRSSFLAGRRLGVLNLGDAVVSTGGGFLNDVFPSQRELVMASLRYGQRRGCPTAMFSQGIGPFNTGRSNTDFWSTLAALDCLGVRDPISLQNAERTDPRVSAELTGDDAFMIATERQSEPTGQMIGVNVRTHDYADIATSDLKLLSDVCRQISASHEAEWIALPISMDPGDGDLIGIKTLLGDEVREGDNWSVSVDDMVERSSSCRVVITGSYHAAVFALSQGVPVVGLAMNAYYRQKMEGLAMQFPAGAVDCIDLRSHEFPRIMMKSVESAWDLSLSFRTGLQARSREIAATCDAKWDEFIAICRES